MQQSVSRRIRTSLIQLAIGILLIGFARNYLNNHPAEMQSIKSSISTARLQITQIIYSIIGKENNTITNQKAQSLGSLKEIINGIQACDPTQPITKYQSLYDRIEQSSLQDFARNGIEYFNLTKEAYDAMQKVCSQEASSGGRSVTL